MKIYQRTAFFLGMAVVFISVHMSSLAFAVDGEPFGPILAGVKSIYVQVEPVGPKTEQKGIAATQLRKGTERQLTKAGIKLLTEREFSKYRSSGSYPLARLDVAVTIDQIEAGGAPLNVNFIVVRARQQAFLGRKPAFRFFAVTWQRQEITYSNDVGDVYEALRAIVDEFISDYNSANR